MKTQGFRRPIPLAVDLLRIRAMELEKKAADPAQLRTAQRSYALGVALLERVRQDGLTVERILVTHGHIDHVSGVPQVHRETGAPIAMHPDDLAILDWERFGQMPFVTTGFAPFSINTRLAHDTALSFQDVSLRVLHTPGHTQGSVCFLFGLDCFAGDTLFQRGIGRTDLPGGDTQKIVFSIRNVLYRLPPKTVVYPGHGPSTTIEEEMLLNPFVPSDR